MSMTTRLAKLEAASPGKRQQVTGFLMHTYDEPMNPQAAPLPGGLFWAIPDDDDQAMEAGT